jgi:hypothetical protein
MSTPNGRTPQPRPTTSTDCVGFKVMLSAYLDGELASAQRFDADRHLLECTACRDLLERAEATDDAIRAICERSPELRAATVGEIGLPEAFESEVLERVRRRSAMRWRRFSSSIGLLATAAAVGLAAIVWWVGVGDRGSDRSSYSGSDRGGRGNLVNETAALPPEWMDLGPGVFGPPTALSIDRRLGRSLPKLTLDELQVVHGAAVLLEAIRTTPFENVAARERLRQIAIYDELLLRLGDVAPRFDMVERRHLGAARSIVMELLRPESDVARWNTLQEDLRAFDLAGELEAIVTAVDARSGV